MNVLLDTHIAVWAVIGSRNLSNAATRWIRESDRVYVSVVSLWEIAIKYVGRRKDFLMSPEQARDTFVAHGYELLAVTPEHAVAVGNLPLLHGDPFDRMLVAQAKHEPLHFITHDETLRQYGEFVIVV